MAENTLNAQPTQSRSRFGGLGVMALVAGIGATHDYTSGGPSSLTRIGFINTPVTIVHGVNYASVKLADFPTGRLIVQSALGSVNFTVTSGAGTITNGASGAWGLGSSPASSTSLTGAMVNYLPSTSFAAGAQGVASAQSAPVMASFASPGFQDGTATAIALYLNLSLATNVNNDGTLVVNGYVDLNWLYCGDQ